MFAFRRDCCTGNMLEASTLTSQIGTITYSASRDGRGGSRLRLVVLNEIPDDSDLRRQWNALVERVERPQVFYTHEWALAVWRAYSATLRPLLFLAYDEQESLCGIAALATDSSRKVASFLCATTADYCDFLSLPEQKDALVGAVLGELRRQGIGSIALANLPADSTTLAVIRQAAGQQRYFCFVRAGYVCAQISLSLLEGRKEGKPVAPGGKRLRRLVNAMARTAPVRFDHARSWEALQPMLAEFLQAHVKRFLEIGRISNLAHPKRQEFLMELARLLSEPRWFVLSRLITGEKTVAWHYGFQFQGTWFWYQPTFDGSLERYWPGFCLLTHAIQEALENPAMKTVDLGLGSEAYKAKFANASRETLYVTLHRSFPRHVGSVFRDRAAAAVRSYPALEKSAETLRKRLGALREDFQREGARRALAWNASQLVRQLWTRDEIFFFEWNDGAPSAAVSSNLQLRPLDLFQLSAAASPYIDDSATLAYLLRAAHRLREKNAEGLALVDASGTPLHFAWVTEFAGFCAPDLNVKLKAPSQDAALLFDCWTPASVRGRGYYVRAIGLIADKVRRAGKRPWIFSAATNSASVRGIEKAGFQRRYSLVRQKFLNLQRITGQPPVAQEAPPAEVSAPV
jgi:CelD/BcsL family acetyltransferase involved in cellulose biosynthesis